MQPPFCIGEEIRKHLISQKLSVAWLATRLHCDPSNLRKLLKNSHIPSDMLYKISYILGRDFFACYSQALIENKTTNGIYPINELNSPL